jgi:dihydrodipicolinate synthase/N-acetylneuraminate lyase
MLNSSEKKLKGTVVPLVTPLSTPYKLDVDGLARMIDYVVDGDMSAIFVLGSTGEGPALPWVLRREMVKRSVEFVSKRIPLLVNVSSDSAGESVKFAMFSESSGADAVVASPPCYLPNSDDELFEFYRTMARSVSIPVYVYNMPELTKVFIGLEVLKRILELPNIGGIKDSSGNFDFFTRLLELFRGCDALSIFMGPDTLTRKALEMGADGGVNAGANLRPEFYSGLYKAVLNGDCAQAFSYEESILLLQEIYKVRPGSVGVIRGLKRMLSEKGLIRNVLSFPGI